VEGFYNKLSDVCDKTPENYALILVGDFNAKIGKEHSNKRVGGRHTWYHKWEWRKISTASHSPQPGNK